MKRRIGLVAGLLALVAIAGYLVAHRPPRPTDWIEASGVMEATEVDISSLTGGKLARLLVDEGDWVKRGELVAEIDRRDVEPQVTQARGALAAAKGQLAQAEAVLAGARLAAANAGEAYTKSTELKGGFETARARYQAAIAARDQAKAALDLVRAGVRSEEIDQARAAVASAQASSENAQRELERLEKLLAQGAVSQQQADLQRTARDAAKAALEAARARLAEAEAGARSQERRQAEAGFAQAQANAEAAARSLATAQELYADKLALKQQLDAAGAQQRAAQQAQVAAAGQVENARGGLAAAEKRLRDAKVTSPLDGAVTIKVREAGETVAPNQAIVRLADLDHMWLRVYVPVTQLDRVKLGQKAEVRADANPGKAYRGRVTEIAQQAEFTPKNVQTREQREKLVFGVKVEVDNPNHELKPGMPADARIKVRPEPARGG
jgi:multidrug efflux pump subunit AcrA (membrane-fusion protein)